MSDLKEIKLIFGIMFLIYGIVSTILSKCFYKHVIMKKKCKSEAVGVVTGYSFVKSGNIHMPKVCYEVSGKSYTFVARPYKWIFESIRSTPFGENEMTYYVDEKQNLHVKQKINSFKGIIRNPMRELYPIGKECTVLYYDKKPKIAYLKGGCTLPILFWMMFILSIFCWAGFIWFAFFLK